MAKTGQRRQKSRTKGRKRKKPVRGGKFDLQKALAKTGIEFHLPGYQFAGPGTHLQKRLALGQMGINRLDRIARTHDLDYSVVKSLQDKWKADDKMIRAISQLPRKKTKTEHFVKALMKTKRKLKL